MMKKVVTLVLVLSMVSMASAGMVSLQIGDTAAPDAISLDVGESVVIQIYSDASDAAVTKQYSVIIALPPTGDSRTYGQFSAYGLESGDQVHPLAVIVQLAADYAYRVDNSGASTVPLTAGVGATFTLYGVAEGAGVVNLTGLSPDGGLLDTIAFTVVPEPATMALLGLGALLLRRKK